MTQPNVPDTKRTKAIADIRQLADWLEANPDVPAPIYFHGQHQMAHLNFEDGISAAEGLARVRSFATRHGVKTDESNHDRTSATVGFGIASYKLLTWHDGGRPGEPDARDVELERLRAELAELKRHGVEPMSVDEIGLTYSREADDPTPVSPARVPLHTGAVVDGGELVEVEPAEPVSEAR